MICSCYERVNYVLIRDERAIGSNHIASTTVNVVCVHRSCGLSLDQSIIVVLNVREGERNKDENEEDADRNAGND